MPDGKVISGLVYIFLATHKCWQQRIGISTATALVVILPSIYLIYPEEISRWVSTVMFLDDHYRAIGTGFTGRMVAWQEALTLFRDNPVFGVGFRMHEQFMTTLPSAHNGYLSMLAETGVFRVTLRFVLIAFVDGDSLIGPRPETGEPSSVFHSSLATYLSPCSIAT